MKTLMNVSRLTATLLSAAFSMLLIAGFSSCKKDDASNVRTPAAGLMAFNLASDKASVGFALSGNNLSNARLGYTDYTGAYLPVYAGNREVRSFDYVTGATIAISSNNFADSMYYSVFLVGANGNYRNLITVDNLDSFTAVSGKVWVRYVNAIPDSTVAPVVTITGNGESSINATAPFASVSAFTLVNAGAARFAVNNSTNIAATRTINLEQNKVYTILFTGVPNPPDSTASVQVKFIQNGSVTP